MSHDDPRPQSASGHGGLYFIVGMLVVVVGLFAYVELGGPSPWSEEPAVDIDVTLPPVTEGSGQ